MHKTKKMIPNKSFNNPISIKGARVHNLKNISIDIPRNKLVVITGVSGSGKSSLAFDTIFAEGQRKYAESLSTYIRQFVSRMHKPDVDSITGLCPAIAVEQKVINTNSRSTVGSLTEIYDYIRLLFARIGKIYSPISNQIVKKFSINDLVNFCAQLKAETKLFILIDCTKDLFKKGVEYFNYLQESGFSRIYTFDTKTKVRKIFKLEDTKFLTDTTVFQGMEIFILLDRIIISKDGLGDDDTIRLADSFKTALNWSQHEIIFDVNEKEFIKFNNQLILDGIQFEEPSVNLFSFNNSYGACKKCQGTGTEFGLDLDLVIPNKLLSVYDGAIAPWNNQKYLNWKKDFILNAARINFPIFKPIHDLDPKDYQLLLEESNFFKGVLYFFANYWKNTPTQGANFNVSDYFNTIACNECKGSRLKKEALYIKVGNHNIVDIFNFTIDQLYSTLNELTLDETDKKIADRILKEIKNRALTMQKVGLGYLSLNRGAGTLSGGESQRIQLTKNLNSNLTNSLYVLDEPSIGLHTRDTKNLIDVLQTLKKLGNTIIVVEHDELMMKSADYIIDIGKFAGSLGGTVIAEGTAVEIMKNKDSLTGQYLNRSLQYQLNPSPRKWTKKITVHKAHLHNLKNITVDFPLNMITVVTGVSGSGKSTLVKNILFNGLAHKLMQNSNKLVGRSFYEDITGDIKDIKQIELIDQNSIGRSSRSNPVTYIQAFDLIRELMAIQPTAKQKGYSAMYFSFNIPYGRCETCQGDGEQIIEMQFLSDIRITCEICNGKRFKPQILEITYKGKNIYDILQLTVDESLEFFKEVQPIVKAIKPLTDVGLGYIKLGQSSNTISGGEAQRIKLASYIGKGSGKSDHILFIFDEPTTGLHSYDIQNLVKALNALIEQGHSVIVVEHNIDFIRCADWLIDIGPEAGEAGGYLLYQGYPKGIKEITNSYTGQYL